jgi:hypothetical protein
VFRLTGVVEKKDDKWLFVLSLFVSPEEPE